ncbi:MAG TPA: class I SAM-dependent methyltransferase [Chitinophagaceae bacterium]|nr:class I SAM-dependent methyltransferase [Chitinophagaceae bacterium]
MTEISYLGNELYLFQYADNWKKYYRNFINPYIKGKVLEVGAGIGSTTSHLCNGNHEQWLCLEPDPTLYTELKHKIDAKKLPACCKSKNGVSADIDATEKYDTILYIDVIEHIEEDRKELAHAITHLNTNGHLIVLVPAHQLLFNQFDKAIGHYRRYNKKRLLSAAPGDLHLQKLFYLDSAGLFASMMNKYFLKQDYPTMKQINLWNRVMVPISKITDRIVNYTFGKSLVGVWKK